MNYKVSIQNKLIFNDLLLQYNKYRRKLYNLQASGRNIRKQGILEKRIRNLWEKLMELKRLIKLSTAAAAMALGIAMTTPQSAQAQHFLPPQLNPFGLDTLNNSYITIPAFADIDNDGDIDMLSSGYFYGNSYDYYGTFYYYDNIGSATSPTFMPPVTNIFGLDTSSYVLFPTFVDLDGDGDMDIVAGSRYGNIYYFENTGTANAPSFAAPVKNPFGFIPDTLSYITIPTFADLDGDGDMDMISGSAYGSFYYYQNIGSPTFPHFDTAVVNPFGLAAPYSGYFTIPAFVDLDKDGDMDIMATSYYGNFYYYKNIGTTTSPTFDTAMINPYGLTNVNEYYLFLAFADLDNDGDMDMMVGSNSYANYMYYENTGGMGIKVNNPTSCKIYPNPVQKELKIDGIADISDIKLYSITGQLLQEFKPQGNSFVIDMSKYEQGMYLIKLQAKSGEIQTARVVKE